MDIEDDLRRLFQDKRLDIQAAADAEQAVVAGARRVRRNRATAIATAGVLSAALLVGGGFVLTGGGPEPVGTANEPPALPITSTTSRPTFPPGLPPSGQPVPREPTPSTTGKRTSSPAATAKPEVRAVLGPTGYGDIRLGMSVNELIRTGQPPAQRGTPADTCTVYRLKDAPETSTVTVSNTRGVVAIELSAVVQTPTGITIGSPQDEVKAKHPDLSGTSARVSGNAKATYRFTFERGVVTRIALIATDQDCEKI